MTDQPPVLLLDIDGVINALQPPWDDVDRTKCHGLTIRWAPAAVDRLRAMHDAGLIEVRWCTTWCGFPDQLAALGAALGLDLASAFGKRPASKTWGDLKVEAAIATLAEGRRLVWVDDGEVDAGRRLFPALAEAEASGRALLVQPESLHGLTAEHLDEIEAFTRTACVPRLS